LFPWFESSILFNAAAFFMLFITILLTNWSIWKQTIQYLEKHDYQHLYVHVQWWIFTNECWCNFICFPFRTFNL
jgi:hypothetical protein